MALPFGIYWAHQMLGSRRGELGKATKLDVLRGALLVSAPCLGFMYYLLLMRLETGSWFEGLGAQRFWGVHSIWNLVDVPNFAVSLFRASYLHEFSGSLIDRLAFIVMATVVPWIWTHRRGLLGWWIAFGLLPAMSGGFVSNVRFSSCNVAALLVFGIWSGSSGGGKAKALAGIACWVVQLWLLWRFLSFRWAG